MVTTGANLRWLTGFTGSAGALAVGPGRALLATDGRYRTQAAEQLAASGVADAVELCIGGVVAQREALAAATSGASAVGLEAGDVTWAAARTWEALLGPTPVVATLGLVEGLRVVKDPAEVARMERAAAIADAALGSVLHLLAGSRGRRHGDRVASSPPRSTTPCGSTAPRTAPSRPSWPRARTRPSPTPGRVDARSAPETRSSSTSAPRSTATART